jgi:hypothetical protein
MRTLAGLLLLAVLAVAGAVTFAGPETLRGALETTGLAQLWPLQAETGQPAGATASAGQQPSAAPGTSSRYTPFRTVAVSEPGEETANVTAGAGPAVTSSLVGRTDLAPPSGQDADGKATKPAAAAAADKKGGYKLGCEAGQRLDRAKHKCIAVRHAAHGKKKNS